MGLLRIMERGGDDVRKFEESLHMAKASIKEACEIFEEMKSQFSSRDGGDYYRRHDEDWEERSGYRGRMR